MANAIYVEFFFALSYSKLLTRFTFFFLKRHKSVFAAIPRVFLQKDSRQRMLGRYFRSRERKRGKEKYNKYVTRSIITPQYTYLPNLPTTNFFCQNAQNPLQLSHLSDDPFDLATHTGSLCNSSQDDEDDIQLFQVKLF